jgi:two-component system, LytTR family, response regulator
MIRFLGSAGGKMNAIGVPGITSQQAIPRGARVVVIDPNAEVRDALRDAINDAHTFVLSGLAQNWLEGIDLVNLYVPELLIVRETEITPDAARRLTSGNFPLLVGISSVSASTRFRSALTTLALPLDRYAIADMLGAARVEIYARKANELAQLLDHYLNPASTPQPYLAHLKVDDQGQTIEIATAHVVSISADGNYVRVRTALKTYELRETMTGLSEKLDPRDFVRVHRSHIVNLAHVHDVLDKAGATSLILMKEGTEIPVGPNYRDEISASVHPKLRLTA